MKKIIIILIVLFMTSGCWNYKELNNLGIVSAIGVEKEGDDYLLNVQLVNIVEAGKNGISESPITVITGKGKTLFEASRSLSLRSPKVFFISNLEYVLLDEKIIKDDLDEILDYLTRDTRLPLNFLIITSTDSKPNEILSALSQFDINSSSNLSQIIKLSEKRYGASYSLTIKDLLNYHLSYGIEPIYPSVYLNGNEEETTETENLEKSNSNNFVALKTLVFVNDKKEIISLTEEESFGYNFLVNHISNASITSRCNGGYFTIETLDSNINFKDKLNKNTLIIDGEVEAEIASYGCKDNLNEVKTLDKLSKTAKNTIENYIKDTIKLAKENNTDFIGIGNFIYKNKNNYFDFKNKDWNKNGLSNLNIDYEIKVKLIKQGSLRGDLDE